MSGLEESLYALQWNNSISVAIITMISYEYILQLEKEVKFVWVRAEPRRYQDPELTGYAGKTVVGDDVSIPCCELYPAKVLHGLPFLLLCQVRYFGILVAIISASWGGLFYMPEAPCDGIFLFMQWGNSVYSCLTKVILIWRLYALYNQSKPILYVLLGLFIPIVALYIAVDVFLWSRPSAISTQEIIITPNIKYCTAFFHIGPMPAIYTSIPVMCYDILLVILAIAALGKHLKERKELQMKPNTYIVLIVRYHVIYFVLNLGVQIFSAILWANLSTVVMNIILLFADTAPFIIVPRLIIDIWETHANDSCVHVSTTFQDCVCWTSPPPLEEHDLEVCIESIDPDNIS